jgi:hypothetical protein
LEAILLGRTSTDKNGVFLTDIEIDSPIPVIVDGKISDVFLKAYYNDVLISDSVASNITLNEGLTISKILMLKFLILRSQLKKD